MASRELGRLVPGVIVNLVLLYAVVVAGVIVIVAIRLVHQMDAASV
jgi:hypothetical protein